MAPPSTDTAADTAAVHTDALIVGAGPAGLYAVFALGLLDIRAHLVDALPHVGGQPAQLYADKPIYDIPAIPCSSGQALTDALMRQIQPFAPGLHLGQQVQQVQRQADGRFAVRTHKGLTFVAGVVFIAAGLGAFVPQPLKVDGWAPFDGRQIFHSLADAPALAGQHVLIYGGTQLALDAVGHLACLPAAQRPASLGLLHRRDSFNASDQAIARLRALCAQGQVQLRLGQITGLTHNAGRLHAVQVLGPDGSNSAVALDTLLVLQGLSPQLGPIADWHLALERKQLQVDAEKFQTSQPGIFAIGDINTYPGKRKLIVCAFHEATLAAYAAREHLRPGPQPPLQYTTSSTHLHQLLGV